MNTKQRILLPCFKDCKIRLTHLTLVTSRVTHPSNIIILSGHCSFFSLHFIIRFTPDPDWWTFSFSKISYFSYIWLVIKRFQMLKILVIFVADIFCQTFSMMTVRGSPHSGHSTDSFCLQREQSNPVWHSLPCLTSR